MSEKMESENEQKFSAAVADSTNDNKIVSVILTNDGVEYINVTNPSAFTLICDDMGNILDKRSAFDISDELYEEAKEIALCYQSNGGTMKIRRKVVAV
jgi:viroplasmin and RNaseH domain-containing protein